MFTSASGIIVQVAVERADFVRASDQTQRSVRLCAVVQVQFPERPGALRRFLSALSADWNVTLFHYRNTGNRESYVMLGMQVPPEQDRAFRKVQRALQDEFTFEELGGEERRVFNMFIK